MWADTGEVIAKARDRWALEVPPGVRAINSEMGCGVPLALGATLGAGVGWAVGNGETMNVGIGTGVGAVVLAIIWLGFVAPLITKKFYGWEPRRLK